MLLRSTVLKMENDQAGMGRFFPTQCQKMDMENGDVFVRFSGIGYAHTNMTRKVTFQMAGAVQYNQDFQVSEDCDIYAYFRPRQISGENFQVNKIESQAASYMNSISNMGDSFGRNLLSTKLREGFTVIHDRDEHDSFSLGILTVGQRPMAAIQVNGKDRIPYENQRIEVHQNQREFVGPIEVRESGQSIFIHAKTDGGVPLDAMVFTQQAANAALMQYVELPTVQPIAAPPLWADVIPAQSVGYARAVATPPGIYYVVFDNSAVAGAANPVGAAHEDRAALLDYAIQIGEAQ